MLPTCSHIPSERSRVLSNISSSHSSTSSCFPSQRPRSPPQLLLLRSTPYASPLISPQALKHTYLMRQRQTQPNLVRRNISVTSTLHHLQRGGSRAGLNSRAGDADGVHRRSGGVCRRVRGIWRRDGPNAFVGRKLRGLSFPELCGAGDSGLAKVTCEEAHFTQRLHFTSLPVHVHVLSPNLCSTYVRIHASVPMVMR